MTFSTSRRNFLVQGGKAVVGASLVGTMLEACGGGGSSSSSGPVTLTYGWWSNTPAKDNSMKAWIADFEKSHPNIKINAEILPWTNYWDKLQVSTAGGNAYDIIGLSSGMAAPYYNTGSLVDLSTLSNYQQAASALSSNTLALCKWNGKVYSLPIGTSISVLGYNADMLSKAGIPAPDPKTPMTFDQFKALGAKLYKPGQQYAINPTDILDIPTMVQMEGGSVYDNPVNPTKITINTPAGIQGIMDYKSLFTDNLAPPYAQLNNGPWSFDLGALQTGKIGFARVGAWLFTDIMSSSIKIGITPLFTIKQPTVLGGVNSLAVYAGSKHIPEAWEFVQWASSTQPEISFAKFSDIPANTAAFSQLNSYIQPSSFAPTLQAAYPTFAPLVMTTHQQLSSAFGDITTSLMNNKITPAQAAAQMEQQGNAILSSGQ
ncbi:MAG TPA: hypothetical protein DHW02_06800 [Ktedonobacter sp.]|nr:hypothetical protein [Ktedonobacter sp.]